MARRKSSFPLCAKRMAGNRPDAITGMMTGRKLSWWMVTLIAILYLMALWNVIIAHRAKAAEVDRPPWVNGQTGRATPVIKHGQCPGNYVSSAAYCNPSRRAKACVQKVGQCPSGMLQSGNYCCEMP